MANAVLGANLCPSIFDPTNGLFLTGGQIFFFASDGITPKDVFTSPTREQTLPNPFDLDSIAKLPLVYYDIDDHYVIEIREMPDPLCPECVGDLVYPPFDYFPPGVSGGSSSGEVFNFLSNGTFLYPINFNDTSLAEGRISKEITQICAAWEFEAIGLSQNSAISVFIENIHEQDFPGNPYNQVRVENLALEETTSEIDLRCQLGYVNVLQSQPVTISFDCIANIGAGTLLSIVLHRDFSDTQTDDVILGTLSAPATREKLVLNAEMPANFSGDLDSINGRTYFKIRFPNDAIYDIEITSVQLEVGTVFDPAYIEQPFAVSSAHIIGDIFRHPQDVFPEPSGQDQFTRFLYRTNQIQPYLKTGDVRLAVTDSIKADEIDCDGSSLSIDEYSDSGIPFSRLFDVIGETFGSSGSLSVTSEGAVVTFTSQSQGPPLNDFDAGTTNFTVVETLPAFRMGVKATSFSSTEVDIEWVNDFDVGNSVGNVNGFFTTFASPAPYTFSNSQRSIGSAYVTTFNVDGVDYYRGNSAITATNIQSGSTIQPAICRIQFNNNNLKTDRVGPSKVPLAKNPGDNWSIYANYLQFNSLTTISSGSNVQIVGSGIRPNRNPSSSPMHILFRLDGKLGTHLEGTEQTIIVDVKSSNSVADNVSEFIKSVNNTFVWTVTVTEVPAPSQAFLFSTTTTDEYFWFFLTDGGGGTDPLIPGSTGTQISISSTDTLEEIATNIASNVRDFNFSIPDQADFPVVPNPDFRWVMSI